jgi:hypothetical protein
MYDTFLRWSWAEKDLWDSNLTVFLYGYVVPYIGILLFSILVLSPLSINFQMIALISGFTFFFIRLVWLKLENWYEDLPDESQQTEKRKDESRYMRLVDGEIAEVVEDKVFPEKRKREL